MCNPFIQGNYEHRVCDVCGNLYFERVTQCLCSLSLLPMSCPSILFSPTFLGESNSLFTFLSVRGSREFTREVVVAQDTEWCSLTCYDKSTVIYAVAGVPLVAIATSTRPARPLDDSLRRRRTRSARNGRQDQHTYVYSLNINITHTVIHATTHHTRVLCWTLASPTE